MLEHGGDLRSVARQYDIPLSEWLDLSTGINPIGWPVPSLPAACWQSLPQLDEGLEAAARAYYGAGQLLAVAGSQAAIQALPGLFSPCRVGILSPAYAEHAAAWQGAGHHLQPLSAEGIEAAVDSLDVLLLVNPNNPTGKRFERTRLLAWRQRLQARGGLLLVDEAFIDSDPQQSLAADCGAPGLVVLRSVGKFFGLAGLRVGFVLAWEELLLRLQQRLGPWAVSGPAREVARLALSDLAWQADTRQRLADSSQRLLELLDHHGLRPAGGSELFQYCPTARAEAIRHALARQGIWVRAFRQPPALRFGLPATEAAWQRLDAGLKLALGAGA